MFKNYDEKDTDLCRVLIVLQVNPKESLIRDYYLFDNNKGILNTET